jgi:PRTRC genetic system protein A
MIPIHLNTRDALEPDAPMHYLVASNGIFLVDRSPLFTSVTPVRAVPDLAPAATSLRLAVPRLPRPVIERVYGFFRAVYRAFDAGEAIVFIDYAAESKTFRLGVPPQTLFRRRQASGGWSTEPRVAYGLLPPAHGFVRLGDAHSHGASSAYFSCTDDQDDAHQVGLRIVLGRVDHGRPDMSVSFVAHGTRFHLRAEDAVEEFSVPLTPPRRWLRQVAFRPGDDDAGRRDAPVHDAARDRW